MRRRVDQGYDMTKNLNPYFYSLRSPRCRNPFAADEEEEEREEGFWREVNQHQRGDKRWNAIVKHFREEGIIS